jgi:large subunit ribosomal protein L14
MVFKESKIIAADNTGAGIVRIIHLYGGSRRKFISTGGYILIAIQKRRLARQFVTKNLYLAILITQNLKYRRFQGYYIVFQQNKVLLLSEQKKFIGTRIYGPIALELETSNLTRVLALAKALC